MSKRYALWDRTSDIYTPGGPKYTAQEWIEQYGWIEIPSAVPVCSAGYINGGFIGELNMMKEQSIQMGNTNFRDDMSNQEILDCIEDWEDSINHSSGEPSAQERIAAALEYQNLMME